MHRSPAKLTLLSFCFQGLTLVSALAQAVVPADGRVGAPMNAPIPSTAADAAATVPSADPANVSSYVLGPEDQITVRVFAANDIPGLIDRVKTISFREPICERPRLRQRDLARRSIGAAKFGALAETLIVDRLALAAHIDVGPEIG